MSLLQVWQRWRGIHTRQIYVSDDITSAEKTQREERRGIAGVSLIVKIAAAASEAGLSLEEVYEIASMANKNIYTVSVTTSPAYILETGQPAYELPDGEMEYGMGFNGEKGIERTALSTADEVIGADGSDALGRYESGTRRGDSRIF